MNGTREIQLEALNPVTKDNPQSRPPFYSQRILASRSNRPRPQSTKSLCDNKNREKRAETLLSRLKSKVEDDNRLFEGQSGATRYIFPAGRGRLCGLSWLSSLASPSPITSSRKAMTSLVKDCPNYPRPQFLARKTGRKDRDMANTNRGILHPALPPAGGRHSATQIQTLDPRASLQTPNQAKPAVLHVPEK